MFERESDRTRTLVWKTKALPVVPVSFLKIWDRSNLVSARVMLTIGERSRGARMLMRRPNFSGWYRSD